MFTKEHEKMLSFVIYKGKQECNATMHLGESTKATKERERCTGDSNVLPWIYTRGNSSPQRETSS